jgi:hypothetical protein
MSSQTATPPTRSKPAAPFEEPLFVKYSPHHEFPLSTASSVALHVLVVGLLALGGWLIIKLGLTPNEDALPSDVIAVGGGGGSPTGVGNGPGVGGSPAGETIDQATPPEPLADFPPAQREQLKEARQEALNLPEVQNDEEAIRLIEQAGRHQVDRILRLNKKMREALLTGKGQDGPGRNGGKGTGTGPGEGNRNGPGTGKLDKHVKRSLRWTLIFNTIDGEDYAKQLAYLHAVLAFPDPRNPDEYLFIHDLRKRPVQLQPGSLESWLSQRISWEDYKPSSVRTLAEALGLPGTPPSFRAFFPVDVEQKLLRLELNFRGLKEEEIYETKFELRKTAGGYEPVVVSQR